ncbi:MAG: OmpA family protein [Hyphomicrobiales bacterium]|nr:OmpA family protein [Hyphomicrobiales bacterium]
MRITFYVSAVTGLALLGACSNVDQIKQAELQKPTGSAFSQSAYKEYLGLAKSEQNQGDLRSARHYVTKAKFAASGKQVSPDSLSLRDVAGPEEAAIKSGHRKLNVALKSGVAARKPADTAKAQAMLDCWMEQAEEGVQPSHIRACRSGFETAMAALGARVKVADKRVPASGSPFTVNFKFDSTTLTKESERALTDILRKVSVYKPKSVRVVAYTDLVGNKAYNQKLSGKRALVLSRKLKAAGTAAVVTAAKGASEPVVNTKKANLSNRRAVIVFE